jgi:hypothetical protein
MALLAEHAEGRVSAPLVQFGKARIVPEKPGSAQLVQRALLDQPNVLPGAITEDCELAERAGFAWPKR